MIVQHEIIHERDGFAITVPVEVDETRGTAPHVVERGDGILMRKQRFRPLGPQVDMWIVSADLGKKRDYTAIAVLQVVGGLILVRHVERFPIGTKYPDIRARVKQIVSSPKFPNAILVVDGTGVGEPVVDEMRADGLNPIAFVLKGTGRARTEKTDGGFVTERRCYVPKIDVVDLGRMLSEEGILKVVRDCPFEDVAKKEFGNFRVRLSEAGRQKFGAWRDSEHDDIVLAILIGSYIGWRAVRRAAAAPASTQVETPSSKMSRTWRAHR